MTHQVTRQTTHPGEILKEEFMVPLGLSANALGRALKVPPNRITAIINQQRGVTGDTALRLAKYFKTTPQFWMNLQSNYDLTKAQIISGSTIDQEVTVGPTL